MKGSYILIIELREDIEISIGSLGKFLFPKGYYIYVGSALNSLFRRVSRHLKKNKKNHWHIDYFLKYSSIKVIVLFPFPKKIECEIAKILKGKIVVEKFGSSDCNCKSHLFYYENFNKLIKDINRILLFFKNI